MCFGPIIHNLHILLHYHGRLIHRFHSVQPIFGTQMSMPMDV